MILIKNNLIPFGSFKAITIWPFVLYKGRKPDSITINHESIHLRQQKELLIVFFFIIYFFEWIFKGYKNISFEKEAYANSYDKAYLQSRKPYQMWR